MPSRLSRSPRPRKKPYTGRNVYFASREDLLAIERAAAAAGLTPSAFIVKAAKAASANPPARCRECGQVIAA